MFSADFDILYAWVGTTLNFSAQAIEPSMVELRSQSVSANVYTAVATNMLMIFF